MAMKRLFSAVIMMAALLLVSHKAANEQVRIGDNLRHENVLLPLSTPDKTGLVVIDYVMVLDEDGATAILACYDDLKTKLKIDYVELYDLSGNLLLVNWIDRFGISRFALDRGLFKEHPVVDRVLVLMTSGTEL
jgi:hypothetical protein